MGLRSGDQADQVMRVSPVKPRDPRYDVVALAEFEGTLSCIKIMLRIRDKGSSSSHGDKCSSKNAVYVLFVHLTPLVLGKVQPIHVQQYQTENLTPPPPCWRRIWC